MCTFIYCLKCVCVCGGGGGKCALASSLRRVLMVFIITSMLIFLQ